MSLGFEQSGFDIILGVDRDPYHCAAHERNFPYGKTICDSVTNINSKRISKELGSNSKIDLIFGGPPCQGFSTMGKRDIGDPRSSLVSEFVRIVKEVGPKAFVMENVPGMQLGKTRSFFDFALEELSSSGYIITTPVETLLASDFGAPQKRERLFIIGIRSDYGRAAIYPSKPDPDQPFAKSISEAFEGLPELDKNEQFFEEDGVKFKASKNKVKSYYSLVLSGLDDDPTDFSYKRHSKSGVIFGNKRSKHSKASIELYAATPQGSMVPGHKLPRLDPEGLAPTLRAGTESERGSHTAPRPIHPDYPRCISVREAARLHGYPDWFAFYPVIHHGFRQVGNSVSPFVARAVGKSVLRALGLNSAFEKPSKTIEIDDNFLLPRSSKIAEKRISHLDEFPKVINWLFNSRYNKKTKKITKKFVSYYDIQRAIVKTEAKMPRVRPENFLSEFGKSRNARKIMEIPLAQGYSLKECDGGICFVERNAPGSVGEDISVSFNSAEIKAPKQISIGDRKLNQMETTLAIIERAGLFPKLHKFKDLLGALNEKKQIISIGKSASVQEYAIVWTTSKNQSIKFQVIDKIISSENVQTVVASIRLTERHYGIIIFQKNGKTIKINKKIVYYLVPQVK